MRHQHQLLFPCLLASRGGVLGGGGGGASAVWVYTVCPPTVPLLHAKQGTHEARVMGGQAADEGHVCLCVLVAYRINVAQVCGPAPHFFSCLSGLRGVPSATLWGRSLQPQHWPV